MKMNSFEVFSQFDYKKRMEDHVTFTSYILAAGHGKRLNSALAKPLHPIGGKAMLGWVIDTAMMAGANHLCVVTNPANHQVTDFTKKHYPDMAIAYQDPPQGTGHAAQCALAEAGTANQPVLVLFGDTPLITAETLQRLACAITDGAALCVLGFEAANPAGYGRLKTDQTGKLIAIIEDADANEADKAITTVNAGVMALSPDCAATYLPKLSNNNAQGEYYLTDLVALANDANEIVRLVLADGNEVQGVNSRSDLALVEAALQHRLRHAAMAAGVTLTAPETIFLSADTQLSRDVVIEPHVVFQGRNHIGEGTLIRSFSHLEGAVIGDRAVIGPYARLRPGTELSDGVKIGNFVETKNAQFAKGAKANHLSYIGDASVGEKANIGAGTITCNYDGFDKFKTEIGKGAFIGSNTALVAPVTIGDGAIIGAGSTITKSVDHDDLALTRAPQRTIQQGGKAFRTRKGK